MHHTISTSTHHINTLLAFQLKNTHFLFQGKYYEEVNGAIIDSPISPIVANLFMEVFETKAINMATHLPSLWLRYVDGCCVIQMAEYSLLFLQ